MVNGLAGTSRMRSRRTILVAGSRNQNMQTIARLLQRFGYNIATAEDGDRAAQLAASLRPALIISDLTLPDMTGVKLFHRLNHDQIAASIPMIFSVSSSDAAVERQCLDYGAAACVTRPVQAEELFRTVQEVIEPRPRASIRIDARLPVSINDIPVSCSDGTCLINLSETGMRLPVSTAYASSSKVTLQIQVKERMISAEGMVLYRHTSGFERDRGPGIGVKFVQIEPQDQNFLRKFIREEVMKDINMPDSQQ